MTFQHGIPVPVDREAVLMDDRLSLPSQKSRRSQVLETTRRHF